MSAFATGTGVGPWPGDAPRAAAETVVGELGEGLAYLPELPHRGVGADLVGRGAALLVDIAVDLTPHGYRLSARAGAVRRRAVSLLGEDVDALEEAWDTAGLRGSGHPVKIQAPGPVTLAARLELASGHRAITDRGATRDLTESLAEGLDAHRRDVARRLGAPVVVQLDEPDLPHAIAGRLTGVTALESVAPLETATATAMLDRCLAVAGETLVRCAHPGAAWNVLRHSVSSAVSVSATKPGADDYEGIAAFLDAGRAVVLGIVPAVAPQTPCAVEGLATSIAAVADRAGFGRQVLAGWIGVAPADGLAGASAEWARAATRLARDTATRLAADPDAF